MNALDTAALDRAAAEWRRLFHAEADAWSALVIARCNFQREVEAMPLCFEAVRMAMKRLVEAQRALVEHVGSVRARRDEGVAA